MRGLDGSVGGSLGLFRQAEDLKRGLPQPRDYRRFLLFLLALPSPDVQRVRLHLDQNTPLVDDAWLPTCSHVPALQPLVMGLAVALAEIPESGDWCHHLCDVTIVVDPVEISSRLSSA